MALKFNPITGMLDISGGNFVLKTGDTMTGELNIAISGSNVGAFKAFQEGEASQRFEFTNHGVMNWGGGAGSMDVTVVRRQPNVLQTYGEFWTGTYGAEDTRLGTGRLALADGITAPTTVTGFAQLYVDSADGDLKVKFGDGTVKTIVTDT